MTPSTIEFPALYDSADRGATETQSLFWRLTAAEYSLLFALSIASVTRNFTGLSDIALSLLLIIIAGLFVFKSYKKLDQEWYRCRALAESVKTSTWRFAMRAHPFENAESVQIPKGEFRNTLRDILKANQHIASRLATSDSEQVTASMTAIREFNINDRLDYYITNRIDDQRAWYSKKSSDNRKAFNRWVAGTVFIFIAAAICVNSNHVGLSILSIGFDPLIVLATAAISWMQIKRHSELVASYNLTTQEIGIIRSNSDSVKTEEQLSNFINEAELAFSREHTQWVARRDAN